MELGCSPYHPRDDRTTGGNGGGRRDKEQKAEIAQEETEGAASFVPVSEEEQEGGGGDDYGGQQQPAEDPADFSPALALRASQELCFSTAHQNSLLSYSSCGFRRQRGDLVQAVQPQ